MQDHFTLLHKLENALVSFYLYRKLTTESTLVMSFFLEARSVGYKIQGGAPERDQGGDGGWAVTGERDGYWRSLICIALLASLFHPPTPGFFLHFNPKSIFGVDVFLLSHIAVLMITSWQFCPRGRGDWKCLSRYRFYIMVNAKILNSVINKDRPPTEPEWNTEGFVKLIKGDWDFEVEKKEGEGGKLSEALRSSLLHIR